MREQSRKQLVRWMDRAMINWKRAQSGARKAEARCCLDAIEAVAVGEIRRQGKTKSATPPRS
jgi:hypothetical protein